MSYTCACCGETHEGLPDVSFDRPSPAHSIPPDERQGRVRLSSDVCVVDDAHYFVRGVIEIPIHESNETFGIGVWVSQSASSFHAYLNDPDSDAIGPTTGWLSNGFTFGGEPTLDLRSRLHFLGGGARPVVELEPTDHPLAVAQRDGLSLDEVWRFIHACVDGEVRGGGSV